MGRFVLIVLVVACLSTLSLSGCFGKEPEPEPAPAPDPGEDTGDTYANGVYAYADEVGSGAGANDVAEVNPYGYQNPWGS